MARVSRFLAVFLLAVCFCVFTAIQPANASALDVTCVPPSSDSVTYSPPLTITSQSTTLNISDQYTCASLSVPALTSGSRTASVTRTASCADLLVTSAVVYTVTWNTGQTSTFSVNRTSTIQGAAIVVTDTGTVTAGLFQGDTVLRTITGPSAPVLLCLAGLGTVSSAYGLITLEVTSV